jgi:hypothetical protein
MAWKKMRRKRRRLDWREVRRKMKEINAFYAMGRESIPL